MLKITDKIIGYIPSIGAEKYRKDQVLARTIVGVEKKLETDENLRKELGIKWWIPSTLDFNKEVRRIGKQKKEPKRLLPFTLAWLYNASDTLLEEQIPYKRFEEWSNDPEEPPHPSVLQAVKAAVKAITDKCADPLTAKLQEKMLELVLEIIAHEIELFLQGYVVFYHARRVEFLFMDMLVGFVNPKYYYFLPVCMSKDEATREKDIWTYVKKNMTDKGLDNFDDQWVQRLISVNFSLFGNLMEEGSCTMLYFAGSRSANANPKQLLDFIEGISAKQKKTLAAMIPFFTTDARQIYEKLTGAIYQIAIPLQLVKQYVYASKPYGHPLKKVRTYETAVRVPEEIPTNEIDAVISLYSSKDRNLRFGTFDAFQARIFDLCYYEYGRQSGVKLNRYHLVPSDVMRNYQDYAIEALKTETIPKSLVQPYKSFLKTLKLQDFLPLIDIDQFRQLMREKGMAIL